jgi:hypothetical protein
MALVFPQNLQSIVGLGRPFVSFTNYKDGLDIFLPIPQGISFEDGGTYSTVDMGAIGGAIQNAVNQGGIGNLDPKKVAAEALEMAARTGVGKFAGSEYEEKIAVATKRVVNPNTNTSFSGNTIRSFQFQFTLVGRTQQDTKIIRDIHNGFRKSVYPETTDDQANLYLDYPALWKIKFHKKGKRGTNEYIPKIHECYLTALSTNFNPSANMYRTDGSPVEIQFSLTFQESRVLNRLDIEEYKAG